MPSREMSSRVGVILGFSWINSGVWVLDRSRVSWWVEGREREEPSSESSESACKNFISTT
jgi:hypothetical protein